MLKILRIGSLLYLLILTFGANTSQAQSVKYSVHANIVYHFTKYIEWPVETKKGDFIIGIIGESPLFDELQKSTNAKMSGNQKIIVRHFSEKLESYDCQILFIAEDAGSALKRVLIATQGSPVLIVTEEEGSAQKGSCVNFTIIDDRLTLEFNKPAIQKRNLKIASDLLSLGTVIK